MRVQAAFGLFPVGVAVAAALLTFGPARPAAANGSPVTPQQLNAYHDALMAEVRKGDLLFHGDAATAKAMGVTMSTTGMACAMCHPMASNTHPGSFPKFQDSVRACGGNLLTGAGVG
jgi:thiosulfate dehydrogenase